MKQTHKKNIPNTINKIPSKVKGFTLLELLVVIGIIGILVSMGFASYSTAQKKARDARVKGDLKAIQTSLEQYYSVCGYSYPANIYAVGPGSGGIICLTGTPAPIMPTVPVHPKTGENYSYTQATSSDYTLCAPTPPFESESVTNYCLTSQQ
ncbi:MAG TPA: prepilin-type N-terminal cleavage/methylation domain-containing protein [Candidatus Nitrosocosmicus sp.]|nr:prepilin-type N-terminal cleavage/methylation domain-containing protein [Candidatus Nitrosocosmicus sp.]